MMALQCLPRLLPLLVLCLYHQTSVSGAAVASVKAVGPSQPICAVAGGETIFSCHLNPPLSAVQMEVFWETENKIHLVHHYDNGIESDDKPDKKYKGRTKMIKEAIAHGGVGVSFTNVTLSDAGRYKCAFLSATQNIETSAAFELKVAGASACDLQNERDELIKVRDNLQKEKDTLMKDKGDLIKSRDNLQKEKETLMKDKDNLQKEKANLLKAQGYFIKGLVTLQNDKVILQQYRDAPVSEKDWKWARTFAAELTLDPDTAHRRLILSEDGRSVRMGGRVQDLPDTPQRFHPAPAVLGRERLSSGRHYWEVQVGDMTEWTLGVCDESVSRKGQITVSPHNGYWAVKLVYGEYIVNTSPPTYLAPRVPLTAVGVFLDYEAGRLSLYNVDDRSLLFTSGASFHGILRPFFSPGRIDGGTNAGGLRITPVTRVATGPVFYQHHQYFNVPADINSWYFYP